MLLFVTLVYSVVASTSAALAPPNQDLPHIGKGVYMPLTSMYQYTVGGNSLFSDIPKKCFTELRDIGINKAELLFFHTAGVFYQYLGQELGLQQYEVEPYNFYQTLMDVSESISPKLEVTGAGIQISRETSGWELDTNCLGKIPLEQDLLRDFEALETKISRPSMLSSWSSYHSFLRKYGTHYVTSIRYGNKILHTVFAKSASHYRTEEIGAATCAKLRYAELNFCKDYTESDYQRASKMITSQFFEVRGGGTPERNNLTKANEPSAKNVYDFIHSETDGSQHISVKLEPLTVLLKRRYFGSREFIKALNLEQYYAGFVAQGCTEDRVNGLLTRRFTLVSDAHYIPEYQCQLARRGCHTDYDCHLASSSFWTHCYCYGQTCLKSAHETTARFGVLWKRAARTDESGSYYEGENLSCHYQFGPSCYCDHNAVGVWDKIWPTGKTDFSHDIQMYRQIYANIDMNGGVQRCAVSGWLMVLILSVKFLVL